MMRRSTGERHARRIRDLANELLGEADRLDESARLPLYRPLSIPPYEEVGPGFSVGCDATGLVLAVDGEPVTAEQAMKLATSAFWLVFESMRKDPSDPVAFEAVMADFTERVRFKCYQREPTEAAAVVASCAPQAIRMLREVEWSGQDGWDGDAACPWCAEWMCLSGDGKPYGGHKQDCPWWTLMARIDGTA